MPLTEGERTDADASCWHRDDRAFDRVEVECAIISSRSTCSLEGVAITSWLLTTPLDMPLMESGMFAPPCAAVRRARQE
jgi:molybdopterin-guanine dinucleotide biosynthesis protein A